MFKLVVRGLSNGEIGTALQLSEATVKSHVRSILSKLSLTTPCNSSSLPTRTMCRKNWGGKPRGNAERPRCDPETVELP